MKKIIYVFILLILNACASNQSLIQSNKIYVGMNKDQLRERLLWDSSLGDDAFLNSGFRAYYPDKKVHSRSHIEYELVNLDKSDLM